MARRGENIYLRKDGRYEGRCMKGRKENGKIIYHSVYGRTLSECKQKLTQAKILYFHHDVTCKIYGTGTFKDALRHTFATRLLEENVDIKTISELLGHSSAKTTLDLYGHSCYEHKLKAVKKLEQKQLAS